MESWKSRSRNTLTLTKRALTNLSLNTRKEQYEIFIKLLAPTKRDKILDVGVTSNEKLKDANFFEKIYPHQKMLTAATIDDPALVKKNNPRVKVVHVSPGEKLPFEDKEFDIVVSWATLEHVGSYEQQANFINELSRVSDRLFITTPYRGCVYEPHSGFLFLHWLPLGTFRIICRLLRKGFWSFEENLNLLYIKDIKRMKLAVNIRVFVYKMFKLLPSHLLIYTKK